MNKLITFLTLAGMLMGAMLLYANSQYFPNADGVKLQTQVETLQNTVDKKLDLILEKVDK